MGVDGVHLLVMSRMRSRTDPNNDDHLLQKFKNSNY